MPEETFVEQRARENYQRLLLKFNDFDFTSAEGFAKFLTNLEHEFRVCIMDGISYALRENKK